MRSWWRTRPAHPPSAHSAPYSRAAAPSCPQCPGPPGWGPRARGPQPTTRPPAPNLSPPDVYVYHRLEVPGSSSSSSSSSSSTGSSSSSSTGSSSSTDPASLYRGLALPCGMRLQVLPLLPNKGREAAVFLTHLVTHYQQLPQVRGWGGGEGVRGEGVRVWVWGWG